MALDEDAVNDAVKTIRKLAVLWEGQEALNEKQEKFNESIAKDVRDIREKDIHRDGVIEAVKKDTKDIKEILEKKSKNGLEWFKAITPWGLAAAAFLWGVISSGGIKL